ncbi:GNAT family N-acetyltransferase [Rhizobium cremeum]|uniref:GNAT family N-acetyltransferase n=1 Tax=Rhizobium cremeum TaxID=2813827 RepID=UPI000DDFB0CA|nr:GNAT family N-acetyltransferase [Rhizobium cremeum]MCJ7995230.1 GNAT family N-acetyltransferase [Rhizobium cremeum]MCJ8000458.1 GNAT family N-acetyltransferase [Rhizobium cremeum]
MTLEIKSFSGSDASPFFDDLARLRIAVFRDFPYLYHGDSDYERQYMEIYARSQGSIFVLAIEDDVVVGASTGTPMTAETDEVKAPFIAAGRDPAQYFYFGESVLLPQYRGRGIGVKFFENREAQARKLGLRYATFCAVERPTDHPRRPENYQPLDAFWAKRGYAHHPELRTTFSWRDLDETRESPKPLSFWIRKL